MSGKIKAVLAAVLLLLALALGSPARVDPPAQLAGPGSSTVSG